MQFIPSLLFGISASLDALLVGISYGMRKVPIRFWQNMFISLVTLLGTCLSVGLGARVTPLLPGLLSNYAGSLILMLLGIYYIVKWIIAVLRPASDEAFSHPDITACTSLEKNFSGLTPSEVLLLSFTLSVNNIGIGLSASMAGLTMLPASTATFLCSVLFLFMGNRLGRSKILGLIGHLADPLSGGLLMGLAVLQLIF